MIKLRTGLHARLAPEGSSLQQKEEFKVIEELEDCQKRFVDGDRSALFDALVLCAWMQAVMPEWVADALLSGSGQFESGGITQLGELFGRPTSGKPARKKAHEIRQHEGAILQLLGVHRSRGGTFNTDEYISSVQDLASEFGLPFKPGAREITAVYAKHRAHLLQVSKTGSYTSCIARGELIPRRRGRAPFDGHD